MQGPSTKEEVPDGTRILVAGAGAIGGLVGGRLRASGADVTLLGRPALQAAVQGDGLRISGHTQLIAHPRVITRLEGKFDLVLLTCKAHQTAALGEALVPHVAPGGVVATLQNGLGNAQKLALHFDKVAVCLTSHGVMVEAPGRLRHAGNGTTTVGPHLDPDAAHVAARALQWAGLAPRHVDDVRPHVWQKAIVNAGINPLGATLGVPNGQIRAQAEDLCRALVTEAAQVAHAQGVTLPTDPWQTTLQVLAGTTANKCSMLQDVEARRLTEVEQITGRILRLADQASLDVPATRAAYSDVKQLEASYAPERSAAATRDEARFDGLPV